MDKTYSYPKDKISILLLEGISSSAVETYRSASYQTTSLKESLNEDALLEQISQVHILGIRSKTKVTERILKEARHLLAIGCYCIGTNQVDLAAARKLGISVFNAPFSNTRSVAELTIAELIMLARRAAEKNLKMHRGEWDKSATSCYEVKGKTLGIVGYGHIGPQVSLLAEAFGMKVLFYDIVKKLSLGQATSCSKLEDVLQQSDFVSLHVPETPQTKNMIGAKELRLMKKGSYLLNLSRGTVVQLDALEDAINSGHIAGAALDVFPEEPEKNGSFITSLAKHDNVILTPHIGGSTEEAQHNIGIEVSESMIRYLDTGSTAGAVNFPEVDLPLQGDKHRILHIHQNVPGVLTNINRLISDYQANVSCQFLNTKAEIGYLIVDVDQEISQDVKAAISSLPESIKTRILF